MGGDLEPGDPRIAPEPRPLPSGEPAGPPNREVDGSLERAASLDVIAELPVAEGLGRGAGDTPRIGPEGENLVEEAVGHLLPEAIHDAGSELRAVSPKPDHGER